MDVGAGLRRVAALAGVDRKTARSYTNAAALAGLDRGGALDQLTDELIGAVIEAVRPDRPDGHGQVWEVLRANHDQIVKWVEEGLTVVKICDLLERRGTAVPQRTLHRYCTQCTEYRAVAALARCRWSMVSPAWSARSTSAGWARSLMPNRGATEWCTR
ncbi:integrase catalytic region domain protein [Mycobacterium xenopi 3993]|nr:integrase catalytic region domain protein [Mycobacterium xenopi 3993]